MSQPQEPPSLRDSFANANAHKEAPYVLRMNNGSVYTYYDFMQRMVFVHITGGHTMTPFSQLDHEVLEAAREQLIKMGGKPPALPDVQPASPAAPQPRKFNP